MKNIINLAADYSAAHEPVAVKQLFPVWMQIAAIIFIAIVLILIAKAFLGDIITAVFSKTVTVSATLTSKTAEAFVTQRVYAGGEGGNIGSGVAEKGKEYQFYFTLDNGKTITLLVPKDIYDVAVEGSLGTLVYKGKRFISFNGATEGTKISDDTNVNSFVGLNRNL